MIRGLDDELVAPKYSHVERERRFLADGSRLAEMVNGPHILIEDLYIAGTRMRLRRMTASDTGRVVLKLSKKYAAGDPRARPMVTTYLASSEYALLAGLPAHTLVKRRYPLGDFSVDLFDGALAGLALVESEQADAASLDGLAIPAWVTREVTDDSRYEGGNLAMLDAAAVRLLCR